MAEQHCIGISINDFDIDIASTSSADADERIQVVRLQDVAGPAVAIRDERSAMLPITLAAPHRLSSGEWLSHTLTRIYAGWPQALELSSCQTCIALSASANRQARERCREIARNSGWQNVKVCGHNLTIAIDRFRQSLSPVTALVIQAEFDHVDVSLVSALKGVVRIRDHCSVTAISHRHLDEAILAGVQSTLGMRLSKEVNWNARWLDAYRIRKQLEMTTVTAIELSAMNWGVTGTLDVSHDDLWCALEDGVEVLVGTVKQLLANNRVGKGQLDQILLLGGSPLSWSSVRQRLDDEFAVGTQVVPIHHSSAGAALVAMSDDASLTDTPSTSSISAASAEGDVRKALSRSAGEIRFHFDSDSDSAAIPRMAEDAGFDRSLQAVWTYIRGVFSVSPERSLNLIQQVQREAEILLDELDPQGGASSTAPNPHLLNARRAIEEGRYAEAVSESHFAREIEPDDPSVFREMINMHIEAARRSQSVEHSLQWLECAHSHDQTDTFVHQLLANYAYQRALQLEKEGRKQEALKTVDRSLAFQPFNHDASKLAETLRQPDNS